MLKTPIAFTAILAVLSFTQAFVPPAGKCRNITSLPIDMHGVLKLRHWFSTYYPDGVEFITVDSDYEDIFDTTNNEVRTVHRIKMKDGSVLPYVNKYLKNGTDNIYHEEIIGDKGRKLMFKLHILHIIPEVNAYLYYRCSDTGSLDYDTRFIGLTRGNILEAAEEQELLAKDMSFNFTGGIHKLSNKLPW